MFFYCLLAVLLCTGYEVGACLSTPDEIKLPGSTFTAERITVEKLRGRGAAANKAVFVISFGTTNLYHNGRCWFYRNKSKCLSQMVPAGHHIAINKGSSQTKIGVLEWNDRNKTLHAYSISSAGVKDTNKPYLKFTQSICNDRSNIQPCPTGVTLTVTAHARGRIIGKYSIRHNPNGPVARDLGVGSSQGQGHTGVIHLGNNKEFSSSGCGVNVKRM